MITKQFTNLTILSVFVFLSYVCVYTMNGLDHKGQYLHNPIKSSFIIV